MSTLDHDPQASRSEVEPLFIGVDVGGTFTDAVATSATGRSWRAKSLTTPRAHVDGIVNSLELLAQGNDLHLSDMLQRTTAVSVGTTVVTNAIAEMRGRQMGLLVTKGFRDTLRIARSPRIETVDPFAQSPMPELVPRRRIIEVEERIDATGDVVVPLNEEAMVDAARKLVEGEGIKALAICFLWSFKNPEHEQRARDALQAAFPHVFLSVSHDLYPVIGEYERMVTTCINAFVSEAVSSYVHELEDRLANAGLTGRVYLGQSLGGALEPEEAARRPLHLFNSGPVGGVVGTRRLADAMGIGDVLTGDMGGTSFDVSVSRNSRAQVTHKTRMGRFETGLSQVDITAVGAGGGSICWVDDRGAPRVGPESAGAAPGPACYGLGGTEATVTDIAVVLGLIDPEYFLGGRMKLDVEAARAVVQARLGTLGGSQEEIASQVFRIIVTTLLGAVRAVSVQRGLDPRGLTMFSYGGASGLFAAEMCRGIGVPRVIIPASASVFSAAGLLAGDPIRSEAQTVSWAAATDPLEDINEGYGVLHRAAVENMQSRGFSTDEVDIAWEADMQFAGQTFHVTIPIEPRELVEDDRQKIVKAFQDRYGELYGAGSVWENFPAILVNTRVIARGDRPKPEPQRLSSANDGKLDEAVRGVRTVFLRDAGWTELRCYEAERLPIGQEAAGPCIVEDVDTTILVPEGASVKRDDFGGFDLTTGVS